MQGIAASGLAAKVDVALAAGAPHLDDVRGLAKDLCVPVVVHVGVSDLVPLMAAADMAVGAAGVSAWERCALGLPSVVAVAAANQRSGARLLDEAGAALVIKSKGLPTARDFTDAIASLAGNAGARDAMSRAAAALCDGYGAARVRLAVEDAQQAGDGAPVALRRARAGDEAIMFKWQSDLRTRAFARNAAPPDAATHADWLRDRLADPDCLLNVILHGDEPAGVLRLDRRETESGPGKNNQRWEMSVYVAPERYRLGLGKAALALARAFLPDAVLLAEVLEGNDASHGLFQGAGYERTGGKYQSIPPAVRPARAGVS